MMTNYKETIDPDGNKRVSALEREAKLRFAREEISFFDRRYIHAILDFGCGYGHMLSAIKADVHVGIDISSECREFIASGGENTLVFESFRTHDVVLPDQRYDAIMCHHVCEHIPKEEFAPIMDVFHQRLRPGGFLILGTPNFGSFCARRFGKNFRMYHDETHIAFYTVPELCDLVHKYPDFQILRIAYPYPYGFLRLLKDFPKLFNKKNMSPAWPGNIVTLYIQKDGGVSK